MIRKTNTYMQPGQQNNALQSLQTLKIIPKSATFFCDDYIEGEVELNTSVRVLINDINLVLSTMEYWTTFSQEMNTNIMEKNNQALATLNLDIKKKLKINTKTVYLKEGKYNFGFKFKIPIKVGPSFEFPSKEGKAYFRYVLTANIISPTVSGSCMIYIILKKRQQIVMNKQVSFTTESTIHKLLLFDGGKTRLTVSSLNGTDNFKYGESINFNINVDNTRGKVNVHKCKVVLRRIINFKARNSEIKRTFVDELISKETTTDTLPGENRNFVTNVNLAKIENKNFEINNSGIPYNNITDINFFLTSMKSLLLDCSYTLKFTLYFDSHVKYEDRPRVVINIILCHQSFDEYKKENPNTNINTNNNTKTNVKKKKKASNLLDDMEILEFDQPNKMVIVPNNNVMPPPSFKRNISQPIKNISLPPPPPPPPLPPQPNPIINNNNNVININNIEDDLPTMEELEEDNNQYGDEYNNNNYNNNNYNNNYDNNNFYGNNKYDKNNFYGNNNY